MVLDRNRASLATGEKAAGGAARNSRLQQSVTISIIPLCFAEESAAPNGLASH